MINTNDNTLTNLSSPLRQIEAKVERYCSTTSTKSSVNGNVSIQEKSTSDIKVTTAAGATVLRYGKNILSTKGATDRYGVPITTTDNGVIWDSAINYYFWIPVNIPAGVGIDVSWEAGEEISNWNYQVKFDDGTNYSYTTSGGLWHIPKKNITHIGMRKADTSSTATEPIEIKNIMVELVDIDTSTVQLAAETNFYTAYKGFEPTEFEPYVEPEVIVADANGIAEGFTHLPHMSFFTSTGDNLEVEYNCGEIELQETYTHEDFIKDITIEREGEMGKFFGFGIGQKLSLTLSDKYRELDYKTDTSYRVSFKADAEYVNPHPHFYINPSETSRDENTNDLNIVAYDALFAATAYKVSDLGLTSYTIRQFAEASAAKLGLSLEIQGVEDTSCFDTDYPTGANFDGSESLRQALNAVAEATQTIYFVSGSALTFKRLDKNGQAQLIIPNTNYFELTSGETMTLDAICHATELGDNVYSGSAEDTTQYVRNNPFWDLREDIGDLVDAALAAAGGTAITQFTCSWRGNFLLELGDKIAIAAKDGSLINSFLLKDTVVYTGGLKQESSWSYEENKSEDAKNPSTLGEALKQTYAKVDKVNQKIEMVASEVNTNSEMISALQISTDSITTSVSKMEKDVEENRENISTLGTTLEQTAQDLKVTIKEDTINTINEEGINKVTTETGFTFNKDGLTVSRSTSDLTTTITENGMTVKKEDVDVLIANDNGVDARNLHATTYLFVGKNSRFEDYDNGTRTGCFWIGK